MPVNKYSNPTVDPLDLAQWSFFVVPTVLLSARTRSQHSITLKTLEGLTGKVPFGDLARTVEAAGAVNPTLSSP
jgi:hypothetical protein